jgi:hypothetical protein
MEQALLFTTVKREKEVNGRKQNKPSLQSFSGFGCLKGRGRESKALP